MGPYDGFIWTAYGVSALVVIGAIFVVWRAYVRARDQAAAAEAAFVKRVAATAPVALFVILAVTLWHNLDGRKPFDDVPTVLQGRPVPEVRLPPLDSRTQGFGRAELATGRVTVVNVFASWCVPCRAEVPQLAQLRQVRGVRLIGMAYKDEPKAARAFLDDYGDPYERIGVADGRAAIEWGIYKVPETFIIDGKGVIRGRFGPLTDDNLQHDVLPAIATASRS